MKGNGCLRMEYIFGPQLMLFLQISSSWVKIRNAKKQLPSLSGIGLLLFYGTRIGFDFAYFINLANKVCRGKINFLVVWRCFYFYFLMAPSF